MILTFRKRALAVGATIALSLSVVAVAGAASSDECAPPTDPSSLTQQTAWQECRLDRIDVALDGLTKPAETVTVTKTVTATTAAPTTATSAPATTTTTASPTSTATSTPTATGTPTTGACVGAANTPGGADPWGGCWPGAHNTGYPKGLPGDTRAKVTLTPYAGPLEIKQCTVIDGKRVDHELVLRVGNGTKSKNTPCLTIRNSLIKGVVFTDDDTDRGPVLIEDTEVHPDSLGFWENIGRNNIFAYRVNSHGGQGVIKCSSNCVVEDSWVHGFELGKEYHYNAFGGNGTNNFRIEHNYASCGDWEKKTSPGEDAGCSAVIGFYGDFGPIRDVQIVKNFLASSFAGQPVQAGYCINPGHYPGKPYPDPTSMTITDNVFARGTSGKCGIFGPTNDLNARGKGSTNVWDRNRYEDGVAIPRSEG